MTSDDKYTREPANGEGEQKAKWPIAGGRCSPAELYLIDRAALEVGKKRGHFVVEAALARAKEVLGEAA